MYFSGQVCRPDLQKTGDVVLQCSFATLTTNMIRGNLHSWKAHVLP